MLNRRVSLIIPVYNTVKYLRRCLESAVSQTYENMEIICVDDGSTDGSEKIVDEFAARDGRVIAVHQENRGESHARNTGLRIAGGDYIGFMDCDDWIEPDMYATLVRALEEAGADMAIAGFYREFEEDGKSRITVQNEKPVAPKVFDGERLLRYIYERDSYRTFAYIWDKLYRREIVCGALEGPVFFDESIKLGETSSIWRNVLCVRNGRSMWIKPFIIIYSGKILDAICLTWSGVRIISGPIRS